MWLIDKIETTLYALDTIFKTIQSAMNSYDTFLNRRDTYFDVAHLVDDKIELFIKPPQILKDDAIGFVCHSLHSAATMWSGSRMP